MDPVAAPDAAVVAPLTAPKSGWKTTEAWLAMFLLGVLSYAGQQLLTLLPVILSNPNMPPWVAPLGPIAIVGLGWVMKLIVNNYTKARVALKLGAPSEAATAITTAVTAGATAANSTTDKILAVLNK
jgi:hypothetical protein